jgi:hypothetical protein
VTILAFGQISAQSRESDCRSSAFPQPARKIPAIDLARKFAEDRSQAIWCFQPEV